MSPRLNKIISSGQTWAGLGALIAASRNNIETGGYTPIEPNKQVRNLHVINDLGLTLSDKSHYDCTKENIKQADLTMIMSSDIDNYDCLVAVELSRRFKKPYLIVNPYMDLDYSQVERLNQLKSIHITGTKGGSSIIAQRVLAITTVVINNCQNE